MKKALFILLALTLFFCACGKQEEDDATYALIPMVNIDGVLYLDTGFSADEPNTLDYDGQITSQVHGSKRPTEHEQSNFGTGYDYIFADEGIVILHIDDGWYFFTTEDVRHDMQFPSNAD